MQTKTKIIFSLFALLLLVNGGFVGLYLFFFADKEPAVEEAAKVEQKQANGKEEESTVEGQPEGAEQAVIEAQSDEYYSIHFSYGDAIDLCWKETQSRNNNIIQMYVNEMSTRYNEMENMYVVKLESYIGTPLEYDEKSHTCEIDPEVQGITYYKEMLLRSVVRPTE